jgi:hypothetical protein
MTTRRYFLSPSVHWCLVNDQCVLLDVEGDRYLQMPARQLRALLPFVELGSSTTSDLQHGAVPAELSELADELLAADVLKSSPTATTRAAEMRLPAPTALVSAGRPRPPTGQLLRALSHFLLACATADYFLRRRSLAQILSRVSQRKLKLTKTHPCGTAEREVALTRIFHALRPFYPRDYLCLFDSLALIEFLAHWHICPNWAFGVTIDPFKAHCWVQAGTTVLSDSLNFASRWFTTILVV